MDNEIVKLENLKSLKVDEDDIIVLQIDYALSEEQIKSIKEQFSEITKNLHSNKIVVLDRGMAIGSLKKKIDDPKILAQKIYDYLHSHYYTATGIPSCNYADDYSDLNYVDFNDMINLIKLAEFILEE